jgi:hypothetical protein
MNVASILKAKGQAVTTARPDTSLLDITQKLAAKKIGAIVIVGENGQVAGIISERDIIRAIAERGCLLERCLTTPFSGKTTWEHVFDGVRAVGIERTLLSSDCGNPDYPPVEDGLALWADRLLGAEFDEDDVREMIVGQSRRLAGAV